MLDAFVGNDIDYTFDNKRTSFDGFPIPKGISQSQLVQFSNSKWNLNFPSTKSRIVSEYKIFDKTYKNINGIVRQVTLSRGDFDRLQYKMKDMERKN